MQHSWTICIFIIFHWNSQGQSTNQFLFLRDPQGLITPRASLINIQIGNRRQLSLMLIKAGEFHPQKPTMKSVLVLECVLHNLFFFHFYYFRNYFWNQMCLSSVQFNGLRHYLFSFKNLCCYFRGHQTSYTSSCNLEGHLWTSSNSCTLNHSQNIESALSCSLALHLRS